MACPRRARTAGSGLWVVGKGAVVACGHGLYISSPDTKPTIGATIVPNATGALYLEEIVLVNVSAARLPFDTKFDPDPMALLDRQQRRCITTL